MIGIVCGLKSEAAVARRAAATVSCRIAVSGARAAEARAIAGRFVDEGAGLLLSVGVSGGLDPALQPGALIVSQRVLCPDGRPIVADCVGLRSEMGPAGGGWITGSILGSDVIVQTAAAKSRLYRATGALAVDMESHAVAAVAEAAGIPFLAMRAIADPADRALPPPAMDAIAPDGSTRVLATLLRVARAPKHFPELLQLGRDSEAALKALSAGLPRLLDLVARGSGGGDL